MKIKKIFVLLAISLCLSPTFSSLLGQSDYSNTYSSTPNSGYDNFNTQSSSYYGGNSLPYGCQQQSGNGYCTVCKPRFYNQNGVCCEVNNLCNTYDTYTGACLSCYQGYTLSAGSCVPGGNNGGQLPTGCAQVNSYGQCTVCSNRYYLSNGVCCEVSNLCNTYNSNTGACTSCYQGYTLSSGSCVQGGNNGGQLPTGCAQVNSYGQCIVCSNRYYLSNGVCRPVSDQCNAYDSYTGACTSCYQGYTLSSGSCVQGGNNGGQLPTGCSQQNSNGQCIVCYTRYYLSNGVCRPVSDQCRTWDSYNGACTSCYDGYILSSGSCVIGGNNGGQLPTGCTQQNANGQCTACSTRYYLNNGVCRPVSDQCNTWDSYTGACTSCYQGYTLSSGSCIQGGNNGGQLPTGCTQQNANGQCTACSTRYYLRNGECRPVSDQCNTWDSYTGACTSCYQGYTLSSGSCVLGGNNGGQLPTGCSQQNSNGQCTICYTRYYLNNGVCRPVSDQCRTWDSYNGACTSCYDGYTLSAGSCVIGGNNGGQLPTGCTQQNANGQCIACSTRYYLNNGVCRPVSDQCNTWDSYTGACTSCYQGYTLSSGSCVQGGNNGGQLPTGCAQVNSYGQCTVCSNRYYLSNGVCRPVSDQCNTWDSYTGACTSCYQGYTLSAGSCIQGGNNGQLPTGCAQVNSYGQCTVCSNRYYLSNGVCCEVSNLCNTYNSYTGACTSCYQGYTLSSGSCVQGGNNGGQLPTGCAQVNSYGQCIVCSNRYYLSNGVCRPVSDQCNSYNSYTGACTSCYQGYTLSSGSCVPGGNNGGQLPTGCAQVNSYGQCTVCSNRYYLSNGVCCEVSNLCNTYNSYTGACTSCYQGYTLSSGSCVQGGNNGGNNGGHLPTGCAQVNSYGQCIACSNNYYLSNGVCNPINNQCKTYDSSHGGCSSCYDGCYLSGKNCIFHGNGYSNQYSSTTVTGSYINQGGSTQTGSAIYNPNLDFSTYQPQSSSKTVYGVTINSGNQQSGSSHSY